MVDNQNNQKYVMILSVEPKEQPEFIKYFKNKMKSQVVKVFYFEKFNEEIEQK